MKKLIIVMLIFASLFVFAGFNWGYAVRDNETENAIIRHWRTEYNITDKDCR